MRGNSGVHRLESAQPIPQKLGVRRQRHRQAAEENLQANEEIVLQIDIHRAIDRLHGVRLLLRLPRRIGIDRHLEKLADKLTTILDLYRHRIGMFEL